MTWSPAEAFVLGMMLGTGITLMAGGIGVWLEHKRVTRNILRQGFWPLARGYGDRRAEAEVRKASEVTRTVGGPPHQDRKTRQRSARWKR